MCDSKRYMALPVLTHAISNFLVASVNSVKERGRDGIVFYRP